MLSSQLDPIDWATYEPYLWSNEATFYQRSGTLFGILLQTHRLHGQVLASLLLPKHLESSIWLLPCNSNSLLIQLTYASDKLMSAPQVDQAGVPV